MLPEGAAEAVASEDTVASEEAVAAPSPSHNTLVVKVFT
jgi:hypothetical protein